MGFTKASFAVVILQPVIGANVKFFRGFLIQPRMAADDVTVVGSFSEPDEQDDYQLSSCVPAEVKLMVAISYHIISRILEFIFCIYTATILKH